MVQPASSNDAQEQINIGFFWCIPEKTYCTFISFDFTFISFNFRHEHAKIELKNSKRNYDKSEKDLSLPRNEVARQKNIMEEKQKMVSSLKLFLFTSIAL